MDIYRHDESLMDEGFGYIAGLDEAGRGPIAGPVVAAAVVLPRGLRIKGLRDSKQVPERERKDIFFDILCEASDIGVGISDAEVIDRVNILEATKLAMSSAVADLKKYPDLLIIDALRIPSVNIRQLPLIKGESKSAVIAAASIVAKVLRDALMYEYHRIYPEYGFDRHKGYCTREHEKRVAELGPSPLHRKSFRKVKTLHFNF